MNAAAAAVGKVLGQAIGVVIGIGAGLATADALEKYGIQAYNWGRRKIKKSKSRRRW